MNSPESAPAAPTLHDVPPAAALLGYGGLIPFLGLAITAVAGVQPELASRLFVAYSAVILSFLGGIRWGVFGASARPETRDPWIAIAVSLAAWLGLALPGTAALACLAAAHLATALIDYLLPPTGQHPWLRSLRWKLSAGALTGHLVISLA